MENARDLTSPPRWHPTLSRAVYVVFLVLLAEVVAQVVVFTQVGVLPFRDRASPNAEIFEPHPFLVGAPRPGARVARGKLVATIDSLGFRGEEIPSIKPDSVLRVLALGGSTTFGVGVSDEDTWPVSLQHLLDSASRHSYGHYRTAQVINAGVPGYTTLENLITLESHGVFLHPDIVVLYQGLNDIRNGHSPGFRTDYSNFHGISQRRNLELARLRHGSRIGLVRLGAMVLSGLFEQPIAREGEGPRLPGADPRATLVYESNLRAFAALCHGFGLQCLMVPQVLTDAYPVDQQWLRYLDTATLPAVMAEYNAVMRDVALHTRLPFSAGVLAQTWTRADFGDFCHFSGAGGRKFATALLSDVLDLTQERMAGGAGAR